MKPENIKKVWEYYKGYYNRYGRRIFQINHLLESIQRNIDGNFRPARFYRQIDSDIHFEVQCYIIYLQEQEAIEKAQEQQALFEAQQKAYEKTKKQHKNLKKKPQKHRSTKRGICRRNFHIKSHLGITTQLGNDKEFRYLNPKNNSPSGSKRLNSQISTFNSKDYQFNNGSP